MTSGRSVLTAIGLVLLTAGLGASEARQEQSTPARTGLLAGTVYDGQSNLPAAYATVTLWRGADRRVVRADESGEFELRDVPVGLYEASVEPPGGSDLGFPDTRAVIVWPDRVSEWRVFVTRSPTRGSGTEAERTRLLEALDAAITRWNANRPEAYEYSIRVRCFCLVPRTSVRYRVEAGQAMVVGQDPGDGRRTLKYYDTVEELFEQVARTIDRRPERFAVAYDPARGFPRELDADPSRMIMDEEIAFAATGFEVIAPGGVLGAGVVTGSVQLAGGELGAGVEVTTRRNGRTRVTETDAAGAFRFDGLPTGVYTVEAARDGLVMAGPHPPAVLVFPDREARAVVRLFDARPVVTSREAGGPALAGFVAAADPVPGVTVSVMSEAGRRTERVTGVDGSYRFDDLPPGRYRLSASLTGFVAADPSQRERVVEVVDGQTVRMDFALRVSLAGDGTESDRRSRLERLDRRMNEWVEWGLDDYELSVESRCFGACGNFKFRVKDRQSTTVQAEPPGWSGELTVGLFGSVEALFERVLEHVDRTPDVFRVTYHPTLAYPALMTADIARHGSDDELTFTVTELRIVR